LGRSCLSSNHEGKNLWIKRTLIDYGAGATSVKEPQKTSWGTFHTCFRDFNEHLWEVARNPFFWVGVKD